MKTPMREPSLGQRVIKASLFVVTLGFFVFCYQTATSMYQQVYESQLRHDYEQPPAALVTLPNSAEHFALLKKFDTIDSLWVLVNKQRSIDQTYVPQNLIVPNVPLRNLSGINERAVRSDMQTPLETMFADAQQAGLQFMLGSAYRSTNLQQSYLDDYLDRLGDTGYQYSAVPGQSEHQTGLAIDVSNLSGGCTNGSACSLSDAGRAWLAQNAHRYGFHLRYQQGKEAITGYSFEPWHFRYVGVELATALHDSNLTLEEAWPYLQAVHVKNLAREQAAMKAAAEGYY